MNQKQILHYVNKSSARKETKSYCAEKSRSFTSTATEMKGDSSKNKKVVDINTLSDDEFGALPEETLRRMRGDFD